MTVHLSLPKDVEDRLIAQVRAGRHPSVEAAIIEKLSQADDADLLSITGMSPDELRRDLDDAWNNRQGAVDGESVFSRIRDKSASLKAQGQ